MQVIATLPEENVTMIPLEIHSFGAQYKTWNQLSLDLGQLSGWLQTAYQQP